MPKRYAIRLALILVVAVALRLWFWYIQARSGAVPPGDPEEYFRAAVQILGGGYDDAGKWLRPPAYPVLLAALLTLTRGDVALALLWQATLAGLGALTFYWYGMQRFGSRLVAERAALAYALFIPLAAFASSLYAETLFILMLVAGLTLLDRAMAGDTPRDPTVPIVAARVSFHAALFEPHERVSAAQRGVRQSAFGNRSIVNTLGCGALLGVATLTRAVGLFFIPLAALLLVFGGAERRALALRAAALLLGAAIVIAPWTLRNVIVHQRPIIVDTNGTISIWYGTVRSDAERAAGEAQIFALPNLGDRQTLAAKLTLERVRADPLGFIGRMRYKIASLYLLQTRSYAVGDIIAIGGGGAVVVQNAGELPLLWTLLADAQYLLLMPLGLLGLWLAPGGRRTLPAVAWVLLATLLAAVSIGHPRLRLPIVAVALPYAAYAMTEARSWLGALGRWRTGWRRSAGPRPQLTRGQLARIVGCALSIALFFGLTASARYVPWLRSLPAQALAAARWEDVSDRMRYLRAARAADPANPLRTLDLARGSLSIGDDGAADALLAAVSLAEYRNLEAHGLRAMLATRRGDAALARAEVAAIDGYWRAGNDLYDWAWGSALSAPPPTVVPGDPAALGHYRGFAPTTPDVPSGAWTLGDAEVRLAPGCGPIAVVLRGPAGRVVRLTLDGATQQVTLDGATQRVTIQRTVGCAAPAVVRLMSDTSAIDRATIPWYGGAVVERVGR